MFVHNNFSSVREAEWPPFGKSCSLGWPCVLIVFCLCVILVISRLVSRAGLVFRLPQFLFIAYNYLLLLFNLYGMFQKMIF